MSIITFVKNVVPNFERARILEDVSQQLSFLDDTVIINYRNAGKLMAGKQLVSSQGREFAGSVLYHLPEYKTRGLFIGLADYFEQIKEAIRQIEKMVPDIFGPDVTKETLTFQKATVLKYLESTRFLSSYATLMLNRVLMAESATLRKENVDAIIKDNLTPAEVKWLARNAQRFSDTLKALNKKPRDIITAVSQIPEVTADADKEKTLNQTVGQSKLDPLKLGFLSPETSFIYKARIFIAEWQHDNYRAGVEEARQLELRLVDLKSALEGKQDASLEKVITVVKGRLDKLKGRLRDYEESLT